MRGTLDFEAADDVLRLSGVLRRDVVAELSRLLERERPRAGRTLTLDLSGVEAMDSSAVACLVGGWRRAQADGATLVLGPASEAATRALALFRLSPDDAEAKPPAGALEGMGAGLLSGKDAARDFLQLAADCTFALGDVFIRPKRIRWGAVVEQMIEIGSRAMPIVGLITFLVGLTVASQSARQLQTFGAAIFVADLTAVSMVLEMGPLMTAILVAGRSGSSIAAEIATMKVSEEVDALTVMGIDPLRYLAVPRLLALILVMPLLTVMADALGMLGGFLVGIFYLDIAWNAFLNQMLGALDHWDLVKGLSKTFAFAWGIGLIGLFYGFQVRGGATEVGRTTTSSVVAAIFFIIVANCAFSVLFYMVL